MRTAHDRQQVGVGTDDEDDRHRTQKDRRLDIDAGERPGAKSRRPGEFFQFGDAAPMPVAGERIDDLAEPD